MWETVCLFIWVRAGEIEQNEEVEEQICFQPLSSSQSAPSHKPLYVSFGRREGDGQRERERETDKETQKINMFKWWMNTRGGEKEREIQSGNLKKIERIFLFKRIKVILSYSDSICHLKCLFYFNLSNELFLSS